MEQLTQFKGVGLTGRSRQVDKVLTADVFVLRVPNLLITTLRGFG